jgi:hypothetical protein
MVLSEKNGTVYYTNANYCVLSENMVQYITLMKTVVVYPKT